LGLPSAKIVAMSSHASSVSPSLSLVIPSPADKIAEGKITTTSAIRQHALVSPCLTRRPKGAIPVVGSHRPMASLRCTSQAAALTLSLDATTHMEYERQELIGCGNSAWSELVTKASASLSLGRPRAATAARGVRTFCEHAVLRPELFGPEIGRLSEFFTQELRNLQNSTTYCLLFS
jgi:hypothetical protein